MRPYQLVIDRFGGVIGPAAYRGATVISRPCKYDNNINKNINNATRRRLQTSVSVRLQCANAVFRTTTRVWCDFKPDFGDYRSLSERIDDIALIWNNPYTSRGVLARFVIVIFITSRIRLFLFQTSWASFFFYSHRFSDVRYFRAIEGKSAIQSSTSFLRRSLHATWPTPGPPTDSTMKFTLSEWIILGVVGSVHFCCAICISLQAPFYPEEVSNPAYVLYIIFCR